VCATYAILEIVSNIPGRSNEWIPCFPGPQMLAGVRQPAREAGVEIAANAQVGLDKSESTTLSPYPIRQYHCYRVLKPRARFHISDRKTKRSLSSMPGHNLASL